MSELDWWIYLGVGAWSGTAGWAVFIPLFMIQLEKPQWRPEVLDVFYRRFIILQAVRAFHVFQAVLKPMSLAVASGNTENDGKIHLFSLGKAHYTYIYI